MTTIKPNTRPKDSLKKKEMARLTQRASNAQSLQNLIFSIPKINQAVIPMAVDALMDAADQYMASHPLVDRTGRRDKPRISEARAGLRALQSHLAKAQEQLSKLPLDAITAIGQATDIPLDELKCLSKSDVDLGSDENFHSAVGKIGSEIKRARQAVALARDQLVKRPHKVADAARNVLAYQVALVFRDILKKMPSSTRAKQLKDNKSRGGAAYDRVLRATLKAAGVTDYDSGPLITAGLRLLKDPALP
jgi:hypothetical protein